MLILAPCVTTCPKRRYYFFCFSLDNWLDRILLVGRLALMNTKNRFLKI